MRKLALLEPLLVFGLIVAYIWKLRFVHPTCWIAIPALMIFSHLLRHESPRALGVCRNENFRDVESTTYG